MGRCSKSPTQSVAPRAKLAKHIAENSSRKINKFIETAMTTTTTMMMMMKMKEAAASASTATATAKVNAMEMEPPGGRKRVNRAQKGSTPESESSSSPPVDADSSNDANNSAAGSGVSECRRSSRKKTIKFDVRDLLNKNRKSHKIQIEARIDSNAPKVGAGQASREELDNKQKAFIEKSAIFRRFSISENKLPPRPPPPPVALIQTIQQCVGELEQLPLAGGEIDLASISPIARRLSKTQEILSASMMKPKQVNSLIVTKLESASTSTSSPCASGRGKVGRPKSEAAAGTSSPAPQKRRGRPPKSKTAADSDSITESSNDSFIVTEVIAEPSTSKSCAPEEETPQEEECLANGRALSISPDSSTKGIDLKEMLDASAVTLPAPVILDDCMIDSTDDIFVAAEEEVFTEVLSSDESAAFLAKSSPKSQNVAEVSPFARTNSTESNSSDDSERRRKKMRVSVKRVSLPSMIKERLDSTLNRRKIEHKADIIEILSSNDDDSSTSARFRMSLPVVAESVAVLKEDDSRSATPKVVNIGGGRKKQMSNCSTPINVLLEGDNSNSTTLGSIVEISSDSATPVDEILGTKKKTPSPPLRSTPTRRVKNCRRGGADVEADAGKTQESQLWEDVPQQSTNGDARSSSASQEAMEMQQIPADAVNAVPSEGEQASDKEQTDPTLSDPPADQKDVAEATAPEPSRPDTQQPAKSQAVAESPADKRYALRKDALVEAVQVDSQFTDKYQAGVKPTEVLPKIEKDLQDVVETHARKPETATSTGRSKESAASSSAGQKQCNIPEASPTSASTISKNHNDIHDVGALPPASEEVLPQEDATQELPNVLHNQEGSFRRRTRSLRRKTVRKTSDKSGEELDVEAPSIDLHVQKSWHQHPEPAECLSEKSVLSGQHPKASKEVAERLAKTNEHLGRAEPINQVTECPSSRGEFVPTVDEAPTEEANGPATENELVIHKAEQSSSKATLTEINSGRRGSLRAAAKASPSVKKAVTRKTAKTAAKEASPIDQTDSSSEGSKRQVSTPKSRRQIAVDKSKEETSSVCSESSSITSSSSSSASSTSSSSSSSSSSASSSSSSTSSSSSVSSSSSSTSSTSTSSSSSSSSSSSGGRATRSKKIQQTILEDPVVVESKREPRESSRVTPTRKAKAGSHSSDVVAKPSRKSEEQFTEADSEGSESCTVKQPLQTELVPDNSQFKERLKIIQRRKSVRLNRWSSASRAEETNETSSESSETSPTTRKTRTGRSRGRSEVEAVESTPSERRRGPERKLSHRSLSQENTAPTRRKASERKLSERSFSRMNAKSKQAVVDALQDSALENNVNVAHQAESKEEIAARSRVKRRTRRLVPLKGESSSAANTLSDDETSSSTQLKPRTTRARRKTISSAKELAEILNTSLSPPDRALEYSPQKSRKSSADVDAVDPTPQPVAQEVPIQSKTATAKNEQAEISDSVSQKGASEECKEDAIPSGSTADDVKDEPDLLKTEDALDSKPENVNELKPEKQQERDELDGVDGAGDSGNLAHKVDAILTTDTPAAAFTGETVFRELSGARESVEAVETSSQGDAASDESTTTEKTNGGLDLNVESTRNSINPETLKPAVEIIQEVTADVSAESTKEQPEEAAEEEPTPQSSSPELVAEMEDVTGSNCASAADENQIISCACALEAAEEPVSSDDAAETAEVTSNADAISVPKPDSLQKAPEESFDAAPTAEENFQKSEPPEQCSAENERQIFAYPEKCQHKKESSPRKKKKNLSHQADALKAKEDLTRKKKTSKFHDEANKEVDSRATSSESNNSDDYNKIEPKTAPHRQLDSSFIESLEKSILKPLSVKKSIKKKDKEPAVTPTAKEEPRKSKKVHEIQDEQKKLDNCSPKAKKKPKDSPKCEKKPEADTITKRKSATKIKSFEAIKPVESVEAEVPNHNPPPAEAAAPVTSEEVPVETPVATIPKAPKNKAESKFYSDDVPHQEQPPAAVETPANAEDEAKEKSPDLLPDPLKDIEKFIEDGVNLLKRGYKVDDEEDDPTLDRDILKSDETMTPKKCKLDDSTDEKKESPPEDDNSNSNSESCTLSTTPTSEIDTPNGIRRSHRIKNNSKTTKCLVGRGLVRDKERFSMKDDEKTVYSIDDQKMDLAEVEAKNSKFLKDMEERLSNFRVIRENEYKCERVISKEAKRMLCDCFLTSEEEGRGELGCGEDCLNRLLMIECGTDCIVRDRCTNRRFTKFLYSPCRVFRTEKKGFGIMADIEILPGEFIMEYVGEVIDGDEFERRRNAYSQDKNKHYYFMALRSDAIIDATAKGNISRFINHSCDPNAETQKWTVNGELRIGFFSRKSIMPGEEITFDYQYQRYGKEAQRCYCESSNCRGWIGEEPSSEEEELDEDEEEGESETEDEEEPVIAPEPAVPSPVPAPIPTDEQLVPVVPVVSELPVKDTEEGMSVISPSPVPVPHPASVKPWKDLQNKKRKEKKRLLERKEDKIKRRETKQYLEDPDIEDEVRFLDKCGLRNQADTLRLSRLIVRAKLLGTRLKLLQILSNGELPCRRLFLDYHGLRLLHGWMSEVIDTRDTEKSMEIRMALLSVLECLPIPNKTMLNDSKVYHTVRDWSNNKESHSPSEESPKDPNSSSSPATEDASSELQKLAGKLVNMWDNLPEVFRIPKRERIEQMKEHEREADRQYKGLGEDVSASEENRNRERFIRSGPNSSRFKWSRSDKDKERERDRRRFTQNGGSGKDGADKAAGMLPGESHLSKEQRRELFAAKVARDEAEKRLAEERREFDIKCRFFGLDPKRIRPENMPFCVNPSTGQWYSTDKKPIATPPSYAHVQVPVKPKSTNPEDYRIPTMDLPPLWKFAISPKGKIYYYHVKIRIPQWEPPIKILPLAGQNNAHAKNSESDSSNAECVDSSEDDIEVIKGLDPVKLQAYIEKKIEDRRLQRYTRLVEEKPISPRKEEDRIYNQIEVRKYKENKEKIRKRKEEIRRRRDTIVKGTAVSVVNPSESGEGDENAADAIPIQDYLLSSDEEDTLKAECNNSPLIDKIVQGDKIVDELDALQCKRPLKRPLPIREKYEHKKRKLEKGKESSKSTKRGKDGEGSSSSKYRKIREKFRCEIAGIIVHHLKPYRKETCLSGRILSDNDFNHLARKLTHFVMVKELKYCESIGQTLVVTESVKNKSREFIKKYMAKYGDVYVRPKNDPEFKEIPFL